MMVGVVVVVFVVNATTAAAVVAFYVEPVQKRCHDAHRLQRVCLHANMWVQHTNSTQTIK